MLSLTSPILDQIIQAISAALWNRPELTPLREPIEKALKDDGFKRLTQTALAELHDRSQSALPKFFDKKFIEQGPVHEALSRYILDGQAFDLDELIRRYAEAYGGGEAIQQAFAAYLPLLRETFAAHPAYGPLLLARDVQSIYAVVNLIRAEMREAFQEIIARFDELRREPEIRALIERKSSHHIFLSYTRDDIRAALKIRNALEAAGHTVWQDTTAIKTGEDWIRSIEDGIERSYALVTLVSEQAQHSKWVKIEYLHAERREKRIYPIKVDASEIPTMMLLDNIAIAHPDFEGGLSKLLADLPSAPSPASETALSPPIAIDRRALEIRYLDGLLLQHSVWQELYTPMAGVGQLRRAKPEVEKPQMRTAPTGIHAKFKARLQKSALRTEEAPQIEERNYSDILPAVRELKRLVILGDPGAGKSTALWRIAADAVTTAKDNPSAPVPILVRMGELGGSSLRARMDEQLGELAPHYADLLAEKRLLFLLDGLNELPSDGRAEHLRAVKDLMRACEDQDMPAALTCREHDYTGPLDLGIPEKVAITPLDPIRVQRFVNAYITEPAGAGDVLFWELAGAYAFRRWEDFSQEVGVELEVFWLADELPEGKEWWRWEYWLKARQQPRSMLTLATNPFMLYMMTQVYTEEGALPPNRGGLFKLFVDFLLEERENLSPEIAASLQMHLADLGYEMQREGEGTSFKRADALRYLGDETNLSRALSASLLTGSDDIRFSHQLLQEYFAAKRLDLEIQNGRPATDFFPPESWWEPIGWEETAILLAGLYSNDCSPVITWLRDAQPELTARCILESGAQIALETYDNLREAWLPRLTDLQRDPEPQARAAIGRALGLLDFDTLTNQRQRPILDNRQGVGIIIRDGIKLPDMAWCEVPEGDFIFGEGDKQQTLTLPTFYIARYPVTYAQFQTFIDDRDGYNNSQWFEGLAADEDDKQLAEQNFKYANHPRETVNWYQAIAFCRWFSWRLGGPYELDKIEDWAVRLPTEAEWEKATRGREGLIYPYGNEFDASKGNTRETGIGQTSTVGIFPQGASPYGALDMSGNVWDWCLSAWANPYEHQLAGDIEINNSADRHVLRGGSWVDYVNDARAASRDNYSPRNPLRGYNFGFRLVCLRRPMI